MQHKLVYIKWNSTASLGGFELFGCRLKFQYILHSFVVVVFFFVLPFAIMKSSFVGFCCCQELQIQFSAKTCWTGRIVVSAMALASRCDSSPFYDLFSFVSFIFIRASLQAEASHVLRFVYSFHHFCEHSAVETSSNQIKLTILSFFSPSSLLFVCFSHSRAQWFFRRTSKFDQENRFYNK